MRLVYEDSGKEVKIGDNVITFKGDNVKVVYFGEPHKPSSTGRVTVEYNGVQWRPSDGGHQMDYFVGVIKAKWIEREDQ